LNFFASFFHFYKNALGERKYRNTSYYLSSSCFRNSIWFLGKLLRFQKIKRIWYFSQCSLCFHTSALLLKWYISRILLIFLSFLSFCRLIPDYNISFLKFSLKKGSRQRCLQGPQEPQNRTCSIQSLRFCWEKGVRKIIID